MLRRFPRHTLCSLVRHDRNGNLRGVRTMWRCLQYPLWPVGRALQGARRYASIACNLDHHRHLPSLRSIPPPVLHFAETRGRSLNRLPTAKPHHVRLLLKPARLFRVHRGLDNSDDIANRGDAILQRLAFLNSMIRMQRPPEQVACPRNADHGMAIKRWLRGEYEGRDGSRSARVADIFEIDCHLCGKYEIREDRSAENQFPNIRRLPQ
jgi:hypothetical protein